MSTLPISETRDTSRPSQASCREHAIALPNRGNPRCTDWACPNHEAQQRKPWALGDPATRAARGRQVTQRLMALARQRGAAAPQSEVGPGRGEAKPECPCAWVHEANCPVYGVAR